MDDGLLISPSFVMKRVIVDTYVQFLPVLLETSPHSTILEYLEAQGVIRKAYAGV